VFNGNADIRECFQIRMLARYSDQTKRMLVGNIKPFPKKSNIPGRWVVVAGDDVSEVQGPLFTSEELRSVAEGRALGGVTPAEMDSTQGEELSHGVTPAPAADARMLELSAVPIRAVSLQALAEQLADLGVTKKILQHARDRDETFPKAVGGDQFSGYLYDVDQVTEWARRRYARMAAEGVKK
jgi:hypothetical protein